MAVRSDGRMGQYARKLAGPNLGCVSSRQTSSTDADEPIGGTSHQVEPMAPMGQPSTEVAFAPVQACAHERAAADDRDDLGNKRQRQTHGGRQTPRQSTRAPSNHPD